MRDMGRKMPFRGAETAEEMGSDYFELMERVPSRFYYFAAMMSLMGSAFLFTQRRWSWAVFLGQLAPTLLVLPLFYRMLHPSSERMMHGMQELGERARRTTEEYLGS